MQGYSEIFKDLTVVFLFIITIIGFGGYAGNIIQVQFGMDQLQDASTTKNYTVGLYGIL